MWNWLLDVIVRLAHRFTIIFEEPSALISWNWSLFLRRVHTSFLNEVIWTIVEVVQLLHSLRLLYLLGVKYLSLLFSHKLLIPDILAFQQLGVFRFLILVR